MTQCSERGSCPGRVLSRGGYETVQFPVVSSRDCGWGSNRQNQMWRVLLFSWMNDACCNDTCELTGCDCERDTCASSNACSDHGNKWIWIHRVFSSVTNWTRIGRNGEDTHSRMSARKLFFSFFIFAASCFMPRASGLRLSASPPQPSSLRTRLSGTSYPWYFLVLGKTHTTWQ